VETRYEDLVADPQATLRAIYAGLGLGDFSRAEAAVDAHLATQRDYRPNRHDLPAGLRERIAARWRAYAERWGYELA
jgi:omega-hydroxy-beta-dihydromenaquinone-9 sulfotransferase